MHWEVDDRPATLYTRIYMAGMWLTRDKRAFEGAASRRCTRPESANAPVTDRRPG